MIVSLMLTLRPALRLLGADGEAPSVTAAAAAAAAAVARAGRCEPFAVVDAEGQAEERIESASSRQVRRLLPEVPPAGTHAADRAALRKIVAESAALVHRRTHFPSAKDL
jgi:hypothetical protein